VSNLSGTEFNIPFIIHPDDAFWIDNAVEQGQMFGFDMEPLNAPIHFFTENEELNFGNTSFQIIHVPGHSPGHVVLFRSCKDSYWPAMCFLREYWPYRFARGRLPSTCNQHSKANYLSYPTKRRLLRTRARNYNWISKKIKSVFNLS
jgi:hypothetical protein